MASSADSYTEARRRVARHVRRLRAARGLTQEALAGMAGVAARHLQRIEAGGMNPTLETLARLADALGVDVGDLVMPVAWADGVDE